MSFVPISLVSKVWGLQLSQSFRVSRCVEVLTEVYVCCIVKSKAMQAQTKRTLLERAYGSAFPMKMDIERQILTR